MQNWKGRDAIIFIYVEAFVIAQLLGFSLDISVLS